MTEGITKKRMNKKLWPVLNVAVLLLLGAFGGYFFYKYQNLKSNPIPADQAAQAEVDRTIQKVGRLYGSLPADEKPSVATVKDKEKLKDQPFFDKAENGDITLIYSNAKLAILYRPSTDKIINVSTVSVQSNAVTVRIIGDATARANLEKTLKANYPNDVTVQGNGDAKTALTGITVVDLTGQKGEAAKKLADGIKGQVGSLPAGEEKPTGVDFLILVGPQT